MRKLLMSTLIAAAAVVIPIQLALSATAPSGDEIHDCPACNAKNASGGNGSGFFFPGYVCRDENGQVTGGHVINSVNKERKGVAVTILPFPTFVVAPAKMVRGKLIPTVSSMTVFGPPGSTITTVQVKMVRLDGKVIISGDGPAGTKVINLPCPCGPPQSQPPTSTTNVIGTATSIARTPVTTNVVRAVAVTRPAQQGDSLPATGGSDVVLFTACALLGCGLFLGYLKRHRNI